MSVQTIIHKLHVGEVHQQENLIELLGSVKGSKVSGSDNQLPSMVRGLCTINQKLLNLASRCLEELSNSDDEVDLFKSFVNEFVMWFDVNFVVFEKLHACLSDAHLAEEPIYQKPVLHCTNYIDFASAASTLLRNPFVIEKLTEAKSRASDLVDQNHSIVKQSQLNDISFDHVQNLAGRSVSCFFTADQIVKRTEDVPIFMGKTRIEMVLLNLSHRPRPSFDSLVILKVPAAADKRSVVYPPFRVNELAMSLSYNCINFSCLTLDQASAQNRFTVTGNEKLIDAWFHDLKAIFPTDEKLLHSDTVLSLGLGIQTFSANGDDSCQLNCASPESLNLFKESRRSLDSGHSLEIMRKNLSDSGIEAEVKEKQLQVVEAHDEHDSIIAEYGYPEELDGETSSVSDSIECFDFVITKPVKGEVKLRKNSVLSASAVSASSAVSVSSSLPKAPDFVNPAGSAIDVNNFGKAHNPSFATLPTDKPKLTKKKSFLDFFRKKPKTPRTPTKEASEEQTPENQNSSQNGKSEGPSPNENSKARSHSEKSTIPSQSENTSIKTGPENSHPPLDSSIAASSNSSDISVAYPSSDIMNGANLEKRPMASSSRKAHPDLEIHIPKISAFDVNSSQPSSATSVSNRTLPSPFALPSSTSTYFFKPYLNSGGSTSDINDSSTSLARTPEEKPYVIPQEFKDIANADDTLDYYITPTSPNSMKVSKWKHKYGKWELLTTNENVFLKILANYNMYKSWLLVFKEEYDEEYGEVIDKPLLVLDLDDRTNARSSTALDVEIHGVDTLSKQKTHIIVRCYNRNLVQAISTNVNNILEVINSKKALTKSNSFESSATLSSSLMSKPSASSTLTSIFTQLESKHTAASSISGNIEDDKDLQNETNDRLVFERMTIKLHKQMESYEQINKASSWKSLAMYSLAISHSVDSSQAGYYHFDMNIKKDVGDEIKDSYSWSFRDDFIHQHIERIGKAALLVKVSETEMYMLECKGKKEIKRLVDLF